MPTILAATRLGLLIVAVGKIQPMSGISFARIWASFSAAKFPPETMQTVLPILAPLMPRQPEPRRPLRRSRDDRLPTGDRIGDFTQRGHGHRVDRLFHQRPHRLQHGSPADAVNETGRMFDDGRLSASDRCCKRL